MLNAAAEFPFEISIDDHLLWIVASDGSEIQPVEVTSVFIQPGETMDVEIQADQIPGHYWIRARIPSAGIAVDGTVFGDRPIPRGGGIKEVNAVLRYEGVTINGDPQSKPYFLVSLQSAKYSTVHSLHTLLRITRNALQCQRLFLPKIMHLRIKLNMDLMTRI